MTTVGYGDLVPETIQGKLVGGITASFGVVLVSIPAGIFISGCENFATEYAIIA